MMGHGFYNNYICTSKASVVFFRDHPEKPVGPSQTTKAIDALRKKRRSGDGQAVCSSKTTSADPPAKRTLRRNYRRNASHHLDIQVLIFDRGMKSSDELLAFGEEQREEGQRYLADD